MILIKAFNAILHVFINVYLFVFKAYVINFMLGLIYVLVNVLIFVSR